MQRTSFYKSIGDRVRYLRLQRKMTLKELGQCSGIELSRTTVSNIEAGRQQMTAFQLFSFAKALGVTIDDLIGIGAQSGHDYGKGVSASLKNFINDL